DKGKGDRGGSFRLRLGPGQGERVLGPDSGHKVLWYDSGHIKWHGYGPGGESRFDDNNDKDIVRSTNGFSKKFGSGDGKGSELGKSLPPKPSKMYGILQANRCEKSVCLAMGQRGA
ncbi:5467_t:CDS:1, partial [Dentiscutata erythropus]